MLVRYFRWVIFTILNFVGGCVLYPTTRSYYAPEPADGSIQNSQACGYLGTRDAVSRHIQDLSVQVSVRPRATASRAEQHLDLYLTIHGPTGRVFIDPSRVQIVASNPPGSDTISLTADPSISGMSEADTILVIAKYAIGPTLPHTIRVEFSEGALTLDGRQLSIPPFHFNWRSKLDWYYGSINC